MVSPVEPGIELTVRIWPDELDGGYIAECVDLPGCMSQGDTEDEALANIRDAISEVLASMVDDATPAGPSEERPPGSEHHVRIDVAA